MSVNMSTDSKQNGILGLGGASWWDSLFIEIILVVGWFIIKIFRSRSQEPITTLEDCKDSVTCLDISDHEILVGSADNRVRLFDMRRGSIETDYVGGAVSSVCFTRDGQCYLVSCVSNTIKLFDKEYVSHIIINLYLNITHDIP